MSPILVGVDAGATKSVTIAVDERGTRLARAEGPGANPKRHGLHAAAETIITLVAHVVADAAGPSTAADADLVFVAGAGIDRPVHARTLEAALRDRLPPATRVFVVNDTMAVLRAATPDAVGLVVPISTGGNVISRARDGRVTDRGHGIFGGGYVLGALAARAWRRGDTARIGEELAREIHDARIGWRHDRPRRPAPDAALLGAAVARAAERGERLPTRMVDRWCARVRDAVAEERDRLCLPDDVTVIVYGGLGDVSPWLTARIRRAILDAAPVARIVTPASEPAEGAADLAVDAWNGRPLSWEFVPRR